MTKKEFDQIFSACKLEAIGVPENSVESIEEALKKVLSKYSDDEGKMSLYDLTSFLLFESMDYTNKLVYSLFSKILEIPDDKELDS